jgi:hypothetical protein
VVEQVHGARGGVVALACAFADDVVRAQIWSHFDKERGADAGVADLLVGHQQQHQVAVGCKPLPGKGRERDGRRGDLTLHVDRAATPDRPVAFDRRERLNRPLLPPGDHDVQVAEERKRRPRGVSG